MVMELEYYLEAHPVILGDSTKLIALYYIKDVEPTPIPIYMSHKHHDLIVDGNGNLQFWEGCWSDWPNLKNFDLRPYGYAGGESGRKSTSPVAKWMVCNDLGMTWQDLEGIHLYPGDNEYVNCTPENIMLAPKEDEYAEHLALSDLSDIMDQYGDYVRGNLARLWMLSKAHNR